MPALVKTDYIGTITWLGVVPDRLVSARSETRNQLVLSFDGAEGEAHSGVTRPSCCRVVSQHPEGSIIRNVRQITILSAEEIAKTADDMGLEALDPALLGANIVITNIPDFTHVSPSSRLQGPDGTTLTIDMENRPCHIPAREIEADTKGFGARYKAAAKGRRGVTAWVQREGTLQVGQELRLHIPNQRAWTP